MLLNWVGLELSLQVAVTSNMASEKKQYSSTEYMDADGILHLTDDSDASPPAKVRRNVKKDLFCGGRRLCMDQNCANESESATLSGKNTAHYGSSKFQCDICYVIISKDLFWACSHCAKIVCRKCEKKSRKE